MNKKYIPHGSKSSRAVAPILIPQVTFEDILIDLDFIIKDYFKYLNNADWQYIFEKHYGLNGYESTTLADIAREKDVSRERIRQIKFIISHQIKKLMDGKDLKKPRISLVDNKFRFDDFGKDLQDKKVLSIEKCHEIIKRHSVCLGESTKSFIDLIMHLYGYEYSTYDGIAYYYKDYILTDLIKRVNLFKNFMSYQMFFIPENNIKKQFKLNPEEFEFFLLFTDVEFKKEGGIGFYRSTFKNLSNVYFKIYRLLKEAGRPMHVSEIRSESERLGCTISTVNTTVVYGKEARKIKAEIEHVGRSGKLSLKEWGMNTSTIEGLIESTLERFKKPLTINKLLAELNRIRPINRGTLISTISVYRDKYTKYKNKKDSYGLRSWGLPDTLDIRTYKIKKVLDKHVIVSGSIELLKKRGKMSLDEFVTHFEALGFCKPTIYAAFNRNKKLFIKTKKGIHVGVDLNPGADLKDVSKL